MSTLGTIVVSIICASAVICAFIAGFFYAFYWLDKKILKGDLNAIIKRYSQHILK